MGLVFPSGFLFGTSTAATQIETCSDNPWQGLKARDGSVLVETIEHEKHFAEDADIIASLGNAYRCSLDWPKLQKSAYGPLEASVVKEYRRFLRLLKDKGVHVMLVLHHFTEPTWFSWLSNRDIDAFVDYAGKVVDTFADLVDSWNTFNEPLGYASSAYLFGVFPPFKHSPLAMRRVLLNMSIAHKSAYRMIKEKSPDTPVGISNNTMIHEAECLAARPLVALTNWFNLKYVPDLFSEVDFFGMSYYGKIAFRPLPVTEFGSPGMLDALGREHDMMWEYFPQGLKQTLKYFWERYRKPIIITENGCCPVGDDDTYRLRSIQNHLRYAHEAIQEGVDLRGYFHWSTFDNFEWALGRSYKFGLYAVDEKSFERKPKPSAAFYAAIAKKGCLEL